LNWTDTVAVDDPEVARAEEYLRRHACECINIADVARQVSIARVTLERRFREALNISMHDYLTRLRVERAKEILKHSPTLPLGQLARECGFANRLRLNAVFRQLVGVSPKEWRRDAK
jgi:transcriptional regulator GlxA family with amidase domain